MSICKALGVFLLLYVGINLPALAQTCTLNISLTSSNNGTICSGTNVVLTATATDGTAPYTYIWSTGETTATISVNKAGTYSVTVSDQTNGCQPVTKSIAVTESVTPNAPTAANAVVCPNNTATLTATAPGGTYQWYDAPTGGNFLASGDTFTTPPITKTTVYYVEATVNGCTSIRKAVTVSVSGGPNVTGAQICAGNNATLSAAGGTAYNWYDAPGGNLLSTGPSFTTPALTTTTTYYVVANVNGCASQPTPVTAIVIPYPQAPTVTNVTVCNGSSANLHADANGIIEWYDGPSGGTALITSPDYTTPALTATTTYYVQNSTNGCVSPRVPVTVTVNPIPSSPVVPAVTTCSGNTAILTVTAPDPGSTYNWYADNAGSTFLASGKTFTTPVLNSSTIYYVQTVTNGCASPLTQVQVTVNPTPPAPTATVTPVCPGTPATLTAIAPGGTYQWYDAATGGNLLFTGDTYTTPNLAASTTYYLQTTFNGCTSARTAVTATLSASATPPTAGDATTCAGSSVTLVASGANNYQWYDAPTGGTILTAGKVFVTPALNTTTTYYVQTTVNGCPSTRTAVTVTVNAIPPQPTVSGATTVCPGSTATLTANAGGATINWYTSATGGSVVGTGTTFTTPTIFNTTTYYAEATNGSCGSARSAVTISTVPVPYPQYIYSSGTFCTTAGSTFPTINDPAGGTFSASPSGLVIDANTGEVKPSASLVGKYTITFVGNEACHSVTQSVMYITVLPDAGFTYNGPYCQYAATNPSPTYPTPSGSAGAFTVDKPGLVFTPVGGPGTIDLKLSQPGTYNVTNTIAANSGCPTTTVTVSVTINPGVSVNAGPDQTVNENTPVQLAGTIAGGTGKWSGGTGTFADITNPATVYTPGPGEVSATLTYTADPSAGNCGVLSDQVTITIIPAPTAPTAAGATICSGTTVTLSATAPGGNYSWYDAPTGGNLVATGPNFTTDVLTASTTYYVATTISGTTSNRTAVAVTVNPTAAMPTTTTPVVACSNTSAALTAQGSTGNYEWYDAPTGGSLLFSGATFNTPPVTSNISYYLQAIGNGCPSTRVKVDVIYKQAPVITSAANATVCGGNPLNYTITSDIAAAYTWSRPAVAGISNPAVATQSSASINETLQNTGTSPVIVIYNITATANGCTTVFQYKVNVYPSAIVTSAASGSTCNGVALNYTITFDKPGVAFRWSRAAVPGISNVALSGQASATIKEILYNTYNVPVDVTYVINYSMGNCTGTFNYVVTVNPAVNITNTSVASVCNAVPLNFQLTANIPPATFVWSRNATAGISNPTVNNQTTSLINETLVNTSSNTITVLYTITPMAYGCAGPPFNLFVNVFPATGKPVVNTNTPVCVGNTIHLQTPTIAGVTYNWTGPNGFTSTSQNPSIPNITAANAGTYTLTLLANGCPGPSTTADVVVNQSPVANAGTDQIVCVTQTRINLSGKVTGGNGTGIWTTSGTGNFSPSSATLNAEYIPSKQDVTNGSVILTLVSTSKDDCNISSDPLTITFAPTPAVNAGPDQDVCSQNTAVALSGSFLKPGTAVWSTSGSGTFNPSATDIHANYIPSAQDIAGRSVKLTLTFTNPTICDIATDDITINFIPPPTVNAGGTRYVLVDHTITLKPTVSDPNVQYRWSPNVGISDVTVKNPVVTGTKDRYYTLTVTDSRGCVSSDSALVSVSPKLDFYNTFTPNGDGVNDIWNISGIEAYTEAEVDIFDRWGVKIYHSLAYSKPWDGTFNGKPLPAGVYYYVIHLNFNNQIVSGYITLIR